MGRRLVILLLGLAPFAAWGQSAGESHNNHPASFDTKTCDSSEKFYPRESRQLNESGVVWLRFIVESDSSTRSVEIEKSSGFPRLDNASIELISTCRFKPRMVNGTYQSTTGRLSIVWKLEGGTSHVPTLNGQGTQSTLLPCPGDATAFIYRNNCFGTLAYSDGNRFTGEWRDDKPNGLGVYFNVNGSVAQSGRWEDGLVVQGMLLDPRLFPFEANELAKSQRERIAKADQERQSDLELRIALEAREKERLAAEADVERKRRQDLEIKLEEAYRRERQLAEAKERERQQASQPQRLQAALKNERRLALIIGNSSYKVSPLDNPANDATDVAESLKKSGFQTTLVRNATLGQMREATRKFADQLPSADVALIYFAGHGIEANRKNYMVPVNADLKFEYELADQGYDAGIWLEMLESIKSNNADRVNIVILDACRNNSLIGSRNLGRGLGKMDAPSGTFLAYSTAPGKVAADGGRGERNSPFTKHLLRAMQQPNLPIEEVFKEVRRNVGKETSGAQVPWESTSLTGFFTFRQSR